MTTVEQALRAAWVQLDAPFRAQYARRVGGRVDDTLPNDTIVKYVLPAIFTKDAVTHPESRWVSRRERRNVELSGTAVAEDIERIILHNAPLFYAIPQWEIDIRAKAAELGISLFRKDPRTLTSWGVDAAIRYRDAEPAMTPDDALRSVLLERAAEEVRSVDQLTAAVRDESVLADVEAILANWSQLPAHRKTDPAAVAEEKAWTRLGDRLRSAWISGASDDEYLRLTEVWSVLVDEPSLRDYQHVWRARPNLAISSAALERGQRHPAPPIHDEPTPPSDKPLEWSLYRRLHGRFGSGVGSNRTGYPPFDVLLADAAARSLAPLSLNEVSSRLTLIIAASALDFFDPQSSNGPGAASPFLMTLRARLLKGLQQDTRLPRRHGADNDERAEAHELGRTSDGAMLASRQRLEDAHAAYADEFMQSLWVALHNLELDVLRTGAGKQRQRVESWPTARSLLFDVAGKVGKEALAQGTKPVKETSQTAAEVAGMRAADAAPALLGAELLAELVATAEAMADPHEFREVVERIIELEQGLATNLGHAVEDEIERDEQRAIADQLWQAARAELAARRAAEGRATIKLDLSAALALLILRPGNS